VNKREALEICIKMWDWLAENPDNLKIEAAIALKLPDMPFSCAACQYDIQVQKEKDTDCQNCPVWDYSGTPTMCEREEYGRWSSSFEYSRRSSAAKAIADRARCKLEELEDGN